jgi:hypothetical protein
VHLPVVSPLSFVKRNIREKLERAGLAMIGHQEALQMMNGNAEAFSEVCVGQIMAGDSMSNADIATIFGMSEDWALKHFADVPGRCRVGKVIRYPRDGVRKKLRSLLKY